MLNVGSVMGERMFSRRRLLEVTGTSITAAGLVGAANVVTSQQPQEGWKVAEVPVKKPHLLDVAFTSQRGGVWAVGGFGTMLYKKHEGWKIFRSDQPYFLTGADATTQGKGNNPNRRHLWACGSKGKILHVDPVKPRVQTKPHQSEDLTFLDIAVTGKPGDSNVFVGSESGKIHFNLDNGRGKWKSVTPGEGNAIRAIDFYDTFKGHVSDIKGNAFSTVNGRQWHRIGSGGEGERNNGIDSRGEDAVTVAGSTECSLPDYCGSRIGNI